MSEIILALSVLIFIFTLIHIKRIKKTDTVPRPKTSVSSEYLRRSIGEVRIPSTQSNDQKNEIAANITTPNQKYRCDSLNNYNYQIMNFLTPITEEKISYIINNNRA